MAITMKSLVRLADGSIVSVADGLASGALVKTRYWDIQWDDNHGSMIHRSPAWKFESGGCPQHRSEEAARERLAIYRKHGRGQRLVYRDMIDSPDRRYQFGQIGKTTVCEERAHA